MNNQYNDAAISDADLDQVAGGFFAALIAKILAQANSGGSDGGGCRNDPCAQFQAIMDQLVPR
jgi:hypothetical protein